MKKTVLSVLLFIIGLIFPQWGAAIQSEDIDWRGFISQGYMYSNEYNFLADTKGGTFQFNEAGLTLNVGLKPNFFIGMQTLARNLGDISNADLRIDWAVADYRWKDWLGIRAGMPKIPFGLYNETRDIDMLRTSVWLPFGVYNESLRDAFTSYYGAGIYGYIFAGIMGSFNYQAGYGTKDFEKDGGSWKYMETAINYNDIDKVKTNEAFYSSLIWQTPLEGMRIGGTFISISWKAEGTATMYTALPAHIHLDLDVAFRNTLVMTGSAEYIWKDLVFAAEYFRLQMDITASAYIQNIGFPLSNSERILEGFYVSAAYRLNSYFEFEMSYSWSSSDINTYYRTDDRRVGPAHRVSDYCIAGRFDINENWLFKAEMHALDGTDWITTYNPDLTITSEAANTVGDYDDQWWYLFAAKVTYNF